MNIERIFRQELSRRDFLKLVAASVVATVGVTNFLSHLSRFSAAPAARPEPSDTRRGFGSRRFGV